MQKVDRYTKVMLTLLVLGVWAMLLRPLLQPTAARAQQAAIPLSSGNTGVYAEESSLKVGEGKIGVWPNDAFRGNVRYVLSTSQMPKAVLDANAHGWKIKAVTAVTSGTNENIGYTIFVEK